MCAVILLLQFSGGRLRTDALDPALCFDTCRFRPQSQLHCILELLRPGHFVGLIHAAGVHSPCCRALVYTADNCTKIGQREGA